MKNYFMEMLSGLKSWMYEATKAGMSLPVSGAIGGATKQSKLDVLNASRSHRVMRRERGSQPQHVKARMFDRNKSVHIKRFKPSERQPHGKVNHESE